MKSRYNFRFDPELIKKLDQLAKSEQRNRTNMIEVLIAKAVKASVNLD